LRGMPLKVAALSALLTLDVAGTAWAHVTVAPEEVAAEEYETLTVTVPTEKEIPTTEVRVEVPDGFTVSGVQPFPGWDYEFEEDGGLITSVTWSGGEIGPREFQQFLLSAQAPEEPGEYPWRAFQTYEDGSTVEWTGPPDAGEPASVVEVATTGGTGEHEFTARGSLRQRAPGLWWDEPRRLWRRGGRGRGPRVDGGHAAPPVRVTTTPSRWTGPCGR
jgi:uncharacterized protein YcnI